MKPLQLSYTAALYPLVIALAMSACSADTAPALVVSGKQYMQKKDFKAAAIQFKTALQLDPQSVETHFLLGEALLNSGDPAGAVIELTKAGDQKYSTDKVVPLLAKALLLTGNHKKLVTVYGDISLPSKEAQASLKSSVATAWGALSDKSKSEAAIAAALAAQPDYGPALILNALTMVGRRDFDGALALVDKVVAKDDAFYEAWQLKGEVLAFAKGDAKAAEEAFRKALSIEPAYMAAHLALISSRLHQGDIAGGKALVEKARAALPSHPMMHLVDAQVALTEKDYSKARELVQQLLRIAPDHGGVLNVAGVLEAQNGSLTIAEKHFAKALQLNESSAFARRSLAQVNLRMGRPGPALATLRPLIAADSTNAQALALAGDCALRMGDAAAAEEYFKRASKLAPGDARMQMAVTLSHFNKGDASLAFSELEGIAAKTNDAFVDQALISARFKRKEFPQALAAADAFAKKQPTNATAHHLQGQVLLASGETESARAAFERALKIDPAFYGAVADLAAIDLMNKKPAQAQSRFEAAIKADPRNHYAIMALAELRLRNGGTVDEVKTLIMSAISAAPGSPEPRLQLIELALQKRQYKEALATAQEAASSFPDDVKVMDAVGRAQMEAGNLEQAAISFRRMAAIDPSSPLAYTRLADAYQANGQKSQAETALRKALEIAPNLNAVQHRLLELLITSKKQKEAMDFVRQVQQRQPGRREGFLLESAYHYRVKDPNAAIAALRSGVAKTDDGFLAVALYQSLEKHGHTAEADLFGTNWMKTHPSDSAFEYHLAVTNMKRGQLDQASQRLLRVVTQFPNNALAHNNLAWVLLSQGKPGATGYAQRASELAPTNASVLDTLAMAFAADKRVAEALTTQKRALELEPTNNLLRLNLAKIALQANDKNLAKQELERLQTFGTSFPSHAEVSKLLNAL
jgi:putative PEP-CTERM system TPR-repeat lipoprotein